MEIAIRWAPDKVLDSKRFLVADVSNNTVELRQSRHVSDRKVQYDILRTRDRLPNFIAFDWHREFQDLVALGTTSGESRIYSLDRNNEIYEKPLIFSIRQQRRCNSLAFNRGNLLASAYDKHRSDSSLNVWDHTRQTSEPLRRFANGDAITNVKFFNDQPDVILAGSRPTRGHFLRIYDTREPSNESVASFVTNNCHMLSIDPNDNNYFASAGPPGDNVVSIWDRRALVHSSVNTLQSMAAQSAVLEFRPIIDPHYQATLYSVRYSEYRRGYFGALSSLGELCCIETARYPSYTTEEHIPSATHYALKTNTLEKPRGLDNNNNELGNDRAVAFDFACPDVLHKGETVITIRQDRSIESRVCSSRKSNINLTPRSELSIVGEDEGMLIIPSDATNDIARDLQGVRSKVKDELLSQTPNPPNSSREKHDQHLQFGEGGFKLSNPDVLTIEDCHRRRCMEGYGFDIQKNKEIVRDDPWLCEFWTTVGRLQDISKDRDMQNKKADLSLLGAYDIWHRRLESNRCRSTIQLPSNYEETNQRKRQLFTEVVDTIVDRAGWPPFRGTQTLHPTLRQLCLAVSGWKFDETAIRSQCNEIFDAGGYYRAITYAFCHERRDIAMDILKSALRQKLINDSGLPAVIATSNVSKGQRELCGWMAEEASDPYLKALLKYFVTSEWSSIAELPDLPLCFRVGIALKHYSDNALTEFFDNTMNDVIQTGDVEGILLTGLSSSSTLDLLTNYISKSSDIQTAALVSMLVPPHYLPEEDVRIENWQEIFLNELILRWRAIKQRQILLHTRPTHSNTADDYPSRSDGPTTICFHCQNLLSTAPLTDNYPPPTNLRISNQGIGPNQRRPNILDTSHCAKCGRARPRCSLCLKIVDGKGGGIMCGACGHGYHRGCAVDWFGRGGGREGGSCAVSGCECGCGWGSFGLGGD